MSSPAVFFPLLLAFVVMLALGHKSLSDATSRSVANGTLCFVLALILGLGLLTGIEEALR